MELKTAIEKAKNDETIKKLDGYFLGSCFACIKKAKDPINEWTLLFCKDGKAVDCFVNDGSVTISKETRPLKDVKQGNPEEATVTAETALKLADSKHKKPTANILITLHQKDALVWTITMIDMTMTATSYDIDAKTGNIVKEETTSLIRQI